MLLSTHASFHTCLKPCTCSYLLAPIFTLASSPAHALAYPWASLLTPLLSPTRPAEPKLNSYPCHSLHLFAYLFPHLHLSLALNPLSTLVRPADPKAQPLAAPLATNLPTPPPHPQNPKLNLQTDERFRKVSDVCRSLLAQLLEPDPRRRLTPRDALKHEWLASMPPQRSKTRLRLKSSISVNDMLRSLELPRCGVGARPLGGQVHARCVRWGGRGGLGIVALLATA
eukprot:354222-Chlamydomonas_euryale.AAC.1